jgi:glycerol-3-phosphate dehydrogenase (NAD(P)+)
MSIAVLGAGAFGTALAIALASKGSVTLWARDPGDMDVARENKRRLPGCRFPDTLRVTDDLKQACDTADVLLLAVPTQQLRRFSDAYQAELHGKPLIACCKGIEMQTGMGPTRILQHVTGNAQCAILTGPSFATDIARGLPTALVLACQNNPLSQTLQQTLTTANLRLYRTKDTLGAEFGGALKNVIAIACGVAMGAGLGESARAALMTRGYAEMQRFAAHLGAEAKTLSGLSGFGDLTLTCTSEQSRNYRLGLSLGASTAFDTALTVEGAATARATRDLAQQIPLDMPITGAVARLLENEINVETAMRQLLDRPLREE